MAPGLELAELAEDLRELASALGTTRTSVSPEELEFLQAGARLARKRRAAAMDEDVEIEDSAGPLVQPVLTVRDLNFAYTGAAPVLCHANFAVYPKQRILLVGVNGAGKSTLLRAICGYHIAQWERFEVGGVNSESGRVPWSDQFKGLAYLGGVWTTQRGFTGPEPYSRDIAAGDMLKDWQEQHRARRDVLVRVLGINLAWRMNRVSDGQRKKVRIMLKLLRPFKLCVIDEFAVELDIFARKRFMDYLASECEERGAAVIYATHIFDQADDWSTHVAFVHSNRTLSPVHELAVYAPYQKLVRAGAQCPMYRLVLEWMLAAQPGADAPQGGDVAEPEATPARSFVYSDSGYESGRSQEIRRLSKTASSSSSASAAAAAAAATMPPPAAPGPVVSA